MGWVVNATPRPFYPRERPGTHRMGGWMVPRAGLEGRGKSRPPTGIRSTDLQPVSCRYSDHRKFVQYEQKFIISPHYVVPRDISMELALAGKVCVKNSCTDLHVNSMNSLVGSRTDVLALHIRPSFLTLLSTSQNPDRINMF